MKEFKNKKRWLVFASASLAVFLSGCATVERIGMSVLYQEAPLGNTRVFLDLPYRESSNPKQRLDLFCPSGTNWPLMIFVYGGGWTSGDKALRVGGKDVYGNIGRFYAAKGIGVAVINYRLQPEVTWRDQVEDVASAVAWVHAQSSRYGADTNRLFLAGHSAGGYLAAFVATNPEPLSRFGVSLKAVRGVVTVSGAALDLADEKTYALGESRAYYQIRFCREGCPPGWERKASPVWFINHDSPPFLIFYAGGEKKSLQRQSELLYSACRKSNVPVRIIEIPGESHRRMVLAMTDRKKGIASAIEAFILGDPRSIGENSRFPK